MDLNIFKHTGRFLILISIQVVILNHIYFGGYITPHIYPLFILLLPFDIKGWVLLVAAFFSGLGVDMFSDSMGMHASASVFMAFMRPAIIRLISIKTDFDPGAEPRIENNGLGWILLYTVLLLFLHHLALFVIEVFRFDEIPQILFRTLLSTGFSLVVIMIAHLLMTKPSGSRT
ncbi:MAG: rod shape-determining protein MreD [Bacteroidetes bacterium]|nr:MAG: rod shape-determining protein MreD [Bacteroidota bacterium]